MPRVRLPRRQRQPRRGLRHRPHHDGDASDAVTPAAPGTAVAPQQPGAPAAPTAAATTTIAAALPTLPNRATLAKLVTAAKLQATLAGPGPYTLFAPSDEAFTRLPAGALDTLLKPESAPTLATIIKYHVVAGALTADQLKAQITAGGGKATLTTLAGQPLIAALGPNGNIELTDTAGIKSYRRYGGHQGDERRRSSHQRHERSEARLM